MSVNYCRRFTSITAVLLLAACAKPQENNGPRPARHDSEIVRRNVAFVNDTLPVLAFPTPHVYGAIRVALEQCSGLTREGWPRFYIAALNPLPGALLGFYDEQTRSVVFALGNENHAGTVAHEILHWLLAPIISPRRGREESWEDFVARVHPEAYFGESGRCAHLLYPTRS